MCLLATSAVFGQSISISAVRTGGTVGGGINSSAASTGTNLSCSTGPTGATTTFPTIWNESGLSGSNTTTMTVTLTFTGFPSAAMSSVRLLKKNNSTNFTTGATAITPSSTGTNTAVFTGVVVANSDRFSVGFASTAAFKDYGDAPDYYHTLSANSGPSHVFSCSNLYLGTNAGYFKSDGVTFTTTDANDNAFKSNGYMPELQVGATSYSVTVPVANNTGNDATLAGWVDFNHDSVFQASEGATALVANGATTATLTWSLSSLNYVGMTWARFRLSTDAGLTTATPGGAMSDGEVEDYYMWISDNKNCGTYNITYITGTGTIGSSTITESGTGGFNDFLTNSSGRNEFGSNNDNNLYYYANGNTFYYYDPISNTQNTLVADVQGLGTVPFSSAAGGALELSAGYYFNGRIYFTLDLVDGTTTTAGTRCYYYSMDLSADGKSIVAGSLLTYGYIDGADHGDFVIVQEGTGVNAAPVIYDISIDNSSNVLFRKISNLASLVGNTGTITPTNITVNLPSGVTSFLNAQMAYNRSTSTFYISQNTDMYKLTLNGAGTIATMTLVRTGAFSAVPYDMGNNLCVADMGDLPSSFNNTLLANNGAEHGSFNTTVKLGTTITADEDGKPSANSDADGGDDGHPTFPTLVFTNYSVTIKMTKTTASNAYLTAWLDFNNNGVYYANEKSATTTLTSTGTNIPVTVIWPTVPAGSTILNRFARFRISTDNASVQTATGYAPDGEVEDYKVTVIGFPLEVKLTSFNAQAQNKNSLVSWITASEKNSAYFDVEHSTDGRIFTKVGNVKAQGTTDISHNYSYVHTTPVNGVNYYRLKMVDMDGTYQYSETRTVRFGDLSTGTIAVVPNPTTGRTRVVLPAALSENGMIVVYNGMGMIVAKVAAPGMQAVEFDLSNQAPGLYHLVVMDGNDAVYRDKVIKQ